MASINDWAAKAARRIKMEIDSRRGARLGPNDELRESRIAAIIAVHAKPLLDLLAESRRSHYHCDDSWYCCGACANEDHGELDGHDGEASRKGGVCNCGASEWNRRVDRVLEGR